MKQMTYVVTAIVTTWLVTTGCVCHREQSDVDINAVLVSFKELKDTGKLPGLSAGTHGDLSAFKVSHSMQQQDWFKPFAASVKGCRNLFLVEATTSERRLRYLICSDTEKPELAAAYKLDNEVWLRFGD